MAQHNTNTTKPTPLYVISFVLFMGFALVFVRLIFIQGIERDTWLARADQAQEKTVQLEPERGTIYDRNGNVLAMNFDRPSLYAIPGEIKNPKRTAKKLAKILEVRSDRLLRKFKRKKAFVWLKRKIDLEQMKKIDALKIKGIRSVMESKRVYPKGNLFGQVLGFTGLDNQGLEGIEKKHDPILRGTSGAIILERDAHGKSIFPKDLQYIESTPGRDLHLTVDENIQHISERELRRMVESSGAKGGTAIVMNPWNGEILAMAIQPAFNPNKVRTSSPAEWRNRAITDFYEPGSTFKIITASAALEEKLVRPEDLIDCEEGAYRVRGTTIHDHDPFGIISFRQVIAHSSNIGTIKVAEILGPERLSNYAQAFGFGERLGIALNGESPGLLRKTKNWSGRSLASIAIGQEIGVTPLQMVTATSVIANGGYLMTPKIIREVRGKNGEETNPPQIKRRVLSEETAREMTEILKGVVSNTGTAIRAAVSGYTVVGKTGTAQKIDPETRRYSPDKFVSSFVGYVPAEDPVLTILVMVDEPEGKGWGGEIAAPVFSNIAKEVLHYLKVAPNATPPEEIPETQVAGHRATMIHTTGKTEASIQDAVYKIGPAR
ncbi:Cell division protein FtsI [Peptidoglycan synthetase] [hydrothermal vent metagenome]|uniref:Cell division protein FtsI [Peptidoglycan synthetase] n=1 Tax=hydrothermal vent metagenome TaxID=652676 RepID=A0A3B1CNA0_9ZZZZ